MAESPGEGSSKDAATAPPKKRSLFRSPLIAQPIEEKEEEEGVSFFSRAKDLYPMRIAEEERKRQKKLEKKERRRSTVSVERKALSTPESKRRRISDQAEGDSSDSSPNDTRTDGPIRDRRASTHSTPGSRRSGTSQHKAQASPTTLADRYSRDLNNKKVENAKAVSTKPGVILLSSESEGDDNEVKKSTGRANGFGGDDDDEVLELGYHQTPIIQDEEPMFEEAYPELLQRAREREQKKALDRLNAEKLLAERNHASNGGLISIDDDLFQVSSAADMDPVVNILITSSIRGTKPMIFRRKISQNLKPVRHGWCDNQIDGPEQYKSTIFLTWRGKRLYDITTSTMLGLKVDNDGNLTCSDDSLDDKGRLHLEAWTEDLFIAAQKRLLQSGGGEEQDQEEEQEEDNKIKLILKAKDAEPIKIQVRPTTNISKLIKVVRNTQQVPEDKEVILYFDGDVLDPISTAEDVDLGDMDIIEIRIR